MEEQNWMDRVNRLTANTVHEALAKLIEEARVALSLTHDALAEKVGGLDERLQSLEDALTAALSGAEQHVAEGARAAVGEIVERLRAERERSAEGMEQAVARLSHAGGSLTEAVSSIRGVVDEAAERIAAQAADQAAQMRAAFVESMERMQHQFSVQSEHLLDEVTTLQESTAKRLDMLAGEVEALRRDTTTPAATTIDLDEPQADELSVVETPAETAASSERPNDDDWIWTR